MGLLDDAIREHLDLKRRRGADPAEIERAEREALGPVRRDPIASEEAGGSGGVSPVAEEFPTAEGREVLPDGPRNAGSASGTFGGELGDDDLAEDEDWDDYDYEDDHEFEPGHSDPGPDSSVQARPVPEPQPAHSSHPHPDEDPDATRAFQTSQEPDDESDEDVLEETPDFLQDTPDHDRLWFEQRPPKDFDFDE